jgi:F-type H+-transporting ATPase subunit epsilon
MQIEIVTPEKRLYSGEAEMVVAPGGEGDFGALDGHVPTIATLRAGIIEVHGKDKARFFVRRGFAEVTGKRCILLAESAIDLDKTNREEIIKKRENAEASLQKLKSQAAKPAEIAETESVIEDLSNLLAQI